MKLSIRKISSIYTIKQLQESDIPTVLELCKGNPTYYKYMKMEPTFQNLKEDLTALPPGKSMEDKFFVGFYQEDKLIAILDLIVGYPDADTAYIGWFMMNRELQGKGTGTLIITELLLFLKREGFIKARLGCIRENVEAEGFWRKNGFRPTGEESETEHYTVAVMQKGIA